MTQNIWKDATQEILNLLTDGAVGKMAADGTIKLDNTEETESFIALVATGWLFRKARIIQQMAILSEELEKTQ